MLKKGNKIYLLIWWTVIALFTMILVPDWILEEINCYSEAEEYDGKL